MKLLQSHHHHDRVFTFRSSQNLAVEGVACRFFFAALISGAFVSGSVWSARETFPTVFGPTPVVRSVRSCTRLMTISLSTSFPTPRHLIPTFRAIHIAGRPSNMPFLSLFSSCGRGNKSNRKAEHCDGSGSGVFLAGFSDCGYVRSVVSRGAVGITRLS